MRGLSSDGQVPSSMPKWVTVWACALFALTLLVRLLDPTGWLGSDDASYYSAAEHVLRGEPIQRLHHHYARAAVVVPVAVSVALFGHHPVAIWLPMLLGSIVCIGLIVLLGKRLLGWWEGLFAATVVAVLPYYLVLSTTAFPDVFVCLWTTAAVLAAVLASQTPKAASARAMLWLSCGFALGLAVSAKVFAIAVVPAIIFIVWANKVAVRFGVNASPTRGDATLTETDHRALSGASNLSFRAVFHSMFLVACGGLVFQVLEGAFYLWTAGDFFFSLKATLSVQASVPGIAAESGGAALSPWQFVSERLTMLMRPSISGWGWVGVLFWPTLAATWVWNRGARCLVIWALSTFVLVAFMPLSFSNGPHPYPLFHGRHILPACIPFALCLGWSMRCALEKLAGIRWSARLWPAVAACIVFVALHDLRTLNGFRDRATSRVGDAIRELVTNPPWGEEGDIYMTPSTYWRFRILFPDSLRGRLRVAASATSADWWKTTCADIEERWGPLPAPGDAYLLATPGQLSGEGEQWDYGVTLPQAELTAWRLAQPLATLTRGANKCIRRENDNGPTILMLLGKQTFVDHLAQHLEKPPLTGKQAAPSSVASCPPW